MKFNILIFDDEQLVCNSIKRVLADSDKVIHTAITICEARKVMDNNEIDLVLLDYQLGETDGLTVLKEFNEKYPNSSFIILTAYGTIDLAVEAMKNGAYDFIQKEENSEFIKYTVQRALDTLRLKKEVNELKLKCSKDASLPNIVAESSLMKQVVELSKEYANTDATILLTGDTGTGKSYLAKYIHFSSPRFDGPFISINCAAIPRDLLESELFGYEKGAFTGASQSGKQGLIELANNGTLLLDEISDLNLDLQSKLLHFLESNQIYRVGGVKPKKVDVRFVAATNADLIEKVNNREFRSDLYYRLNVAHIALPPLKNRHEDILLLSKYYIDEFNQIFNKSVNKIDKDAETFLLTYSWNGNIRELRNYIERAMLLVKGKELKLPDILRQDMELTPPNDNSYLFNVKINPDDKLNILHETQKQVIEQALVSSENNRSQAARILGIPRTSLNHYIKKYKIQ
ncbi:MAG: sigma-54-dependent Fis family transcriptional regulator [Candidatus Marinimicrobia bacterium]|nr:sigma-54-dependent Fis family transcriptional regulator [Candidatus Neomarinimicrobiota bacterium]MBL7023505.1 sigma-54-dependent Fis family transcriptional regulator [Candidatus Neomarinimicrobiota bacterium]MBL7109536.1 sigma-54-dependent Fis family transcriptional regulator [Candidatus Neomarinimicrobiota bacterium]